MVCRNWRSRDERFCLGRLCGAWGCPLERLTGLLHRHARSVRNPSPTPGWTDAQERGETDWESTRAESRSRAALLAGHPAGVWCWGGSSPGRARRIAVGCCWSPERTTDTSQVLPLITSSPNKIKNRIQHSFLTILDSSQKEKSVYSKNVIIMEPGKIHMVMVGSAEHCQLPVLSWANAECVCSLWLWGSTCSVKS